MARLPSHNLTDAHASGTKRHGLARVLSKFGVCSRSQAEQWIRAGRVSLNGCVVRDPERPVIADAQKIAVDGKLIQTAERVYLLFNKPRGLLVSAADEHGRATVYTALAAAGLPWLGPVG
ncbi:MAG: S4 domain-containing protein, partial [Rhodanobacter sp.]